ncbi:signal peptidase II [Flavobacteriaceae bacterium F89]|uniref:Lipoprotein signal peptidase n=1 Tax=Cerina litoralis TaxID=2874477 RepID=A0AAE3EW30_9FLAO|nr:signal peptidase II [Cerina litoralis]MCG2461229.1 signal peptidase II [Cerina litoralis]
MLGKRFLKKIPVFILILLNFGCDQVSKGLVREKVAPFDYIEVFNDNLILTNVENTGAMMSVGQGLPPVPKIILLQLLPVVILSILIYKILHKTQLDRWLAIAFAFVVGGGVGNLIDRIAYGSVTDFLQIRIGSLKTGIFNMADVSVTVGALFILFIAIRHKKLHF